MGVRRKLGSRSAGQCDSDHVRWTMPGKARSPFQKSPISSAIGSAGVSPAAPRRPRLAVVFVMPEGSFASPCIYRRARRPSAAGETPALLGRPDIVERLALPRRPPPRPRHKLVRRVFTARYRRTIASNAEDRTASAGLHAPRSERPSHQPGGCSRNESRPRLLPRLLVSVLRPAGSRTS